MTADPNRLRRWRAATRQLSPRTVRTRVTLAAGLALTAIVMLGLAALYLLQLRSAEHTVQSQLRTYAIQIEQSAAANGTFPRPLPNFALWPDDQAQVLAPDGTVLAATQYLAGRPAVYRLAPGSDTPVRQAAADGVIPGDVLVIGEHATAGGRPVTIITGTASSFGLLHRVNATFTRLLLFGVPGLLVLACGTVWLVVGRALRPVERIRGAVSAISHADLSHRVPDPGTDDEIGRLARTMNDMLARLDDSAARQRRFVADASHELRTPLTAIRTSLEVGLSHPERAPWPDIACRAVRQAQRLEHLIAELLVLAKSDAGQLGTRRQPVDLAVLLADIRASITAPDVSIDLAVAPGTVTTGNPEELSRMFQNLVDNAARYARRRVLITAVGEAAGITVAISDDGPGIPAAERERVFARFVRLDPSRGHGSGAAGLGLAIARDIATAHDATITLAEAEGGGTRAVITLAGTADAQGGSHPSFGMKMMRLPEPSRTRRQQDGGIAVIRVPDRKPANMAAVTVELALLSRVSYGGLEITGSRLQDLLALLAEDPRAGCSASRLVDTLWSDELPEHPLKALQVLVARARASLGPGVIARRTDIASCCATTRSRPPRSCSARPRPRIGAGLVTTAQRSGMPRRGSRFAPVQRTGTPGTAGRCRRCVRRGSRPTEHWCGPVRLRCHDWGGGQRRPGHWAS